MKLELTDSVVKSLTRESKKYTVWDTASDPTGLGLRVRPTGVKTYVVLARPDGPNGKSHRQVMVTLGRAGTMKLSAARKKAWDALHQMQRGIDPNQEKRKLQIESFGDTKPSVAIAPATRICVTSIQPRRLPGRQPGKRGT